MRGAPAATGPYGRGMRQGLGPTRAQRGRPWGYLVVALLVAFAVGSALGSVRPGIDGGEPPGEPTETPSPEPEPWLPDDPGEWTRLDDAPLRPPGAHVGVWTGAEFLVGFEPEVAAFSPDEEAWRRLPPVPGPLRLGPQAVATGDAVILYGGFLRGADAVRVAPDGYVLDLEEEVWQPLPPAPNAPLWDPVVVWTGEEMIVWGGARPGDAHELGRWPVQGAAYRPDEGSWRPIADAPVEQVYYSSGLWTGEKLIVWGGHHGGPPTDSETGAPFAAAYDPATDSWRRLPAPPLEDPAEAAGVWTGSELLLWGRPPFRLLADAPAVTGARIDPDRPGRGWRFLPEVPLTEQAARSVYGLTAVWAGDAAIFYGGYARSVGLVYRPALEHWAQLPAHRARVNAQAAWTGQEMLLWGGYTTTGPDVDLWVYRVPGREAG